MDDWPERDAVTEVLRAAFTGELDVDEAADRLHDMGVERIGIRSALPEGQGLN